MGAPDCPAESSRGQRQNHSLQCSLVHGFGRLHCYPPEQQLEKGRKQSQMNLREGGGGTSGVPKLGDLWLIMAGGS